MDSKYSRGDKYDIDGMYTVAVKINRLVKDVETGAELHVVEVRKKATLTSTKWLASIRVLEEDEVDDLLAQYPSSVQVQS